METNCGDHYNSKTTIMKTTSHSIILGALALSLVSCDQSTRNSSEPFGEKQIQPAAGAPAEEAARAESDDLAKLGGKWEGELRYLDFGDNKSESTIEAKVQCAYTAADRKLSIVLQFVEPGGKLVDDNASLEIAADGRKMVFDNVDWLVTRRVAQTPKGDLTLTFERDGTDNNKAAHLKITIQLASGNQFTLLRAVRYGDASDYFTRSSYRFTRVIE
jgi:hypothetical protein